MRQTRVVEGVPFYYCETPPNEVKEFWEWDLIKEIEEFHASNGGIWTFRGISEKNIELVAKAGTDRMVDGIPSSTSTYVTPYVSYVFSRARTGILIYDPSQLRNLGNAIGMNREFDEYLFTTTANEALK